jgi:ABC-type multidrug transport system ATPase subunit
MYFRQDDKLFEFFTPREAITFAARLKLKDPVGEQDQKVNQIIADLGLLSAANTPIGSV